jgi:hypothetical protein
MYRREAMPLPIVCELTPETARTRRAALLAALVSRAARREETEDGYRLTFGASSETLRAIADTVDAERQCCRWLNFQVTVTPDSGPIVLTLSGPEGAREFLAALFES